MSRDIWSKWEQTKALSIKAQSADWIHLQHSRGGEKGWMWITTGRGGPGFRPRQPVMEDRALQHGLLPLQHWESVSCLGSRSVPRPALRLKRRWLTHISTALRFCWVCNFLSPSTSPAPPALLAAARHRAAQAWDELSGAAWWWCPLSPPWEWCWGVHQPSLPPPLPPSISLSLSVKILRTGGHGEAAKTGWVSPSSSAADSEGQGRQTIRSSKCFTWVKLPQMNPKS